MPITKTSGYADSSGFVHSTLEAAQAAELETLLSHTQGTGEAYILPSKADECLRLMAKDIIRQRDAILAILTTGPRTRPKARKAAGTTNPRRAAKRAIAATPEVVKTGFAERSEYPLPAMRGAVDNGPERVEQFSEQPT